MPQTVVTAQINLMWGLIPLFILAVLLTLRCAFDLRNVVVETIAPADEDGMRDPEANKKLRLPRWLCLKLVFTCILTFATTVALSFWAGQHNKAVLSFVKHHITQIIGR